MKKFRVAVVYLTVLAFTGACTSTTMIRSSDPQAKVYIDGEYRGTGAAAMTDAKIIGATTSIRLEKDGCEPVNTFISRSEELDVGALVAGVFFLVPLLWLMKYRPDHTLDYRCHPRT